MIKAFDPELLFMECGRCGRPILLEPGDSTDMVLELGVAPESLDATCLLMCDGCPECSPEEPIYDTHVVRDYEPPQLYCRPH